MIKCVNKAALSLLWVSVPVIDSFDRFSSVNLVRVSHMLFNSIFAETNQAELLWLTAELWSGLVGSLHHCATVAQNNTSTRWLRLYRREFTFTSADQQSLKSKANSLMSSVVMKHLPPAVTWVSESAVPPFSPKSAPLCDLPHTLRWVQPAPHHMCFCQSHRLTVPSGSQHAAHTPLRLTSPTSATALSTDLWEISVDLLGWTFTCVGAGVRERDVHSGSAAVTPKWHLSKVGWWDSC